MISISTFNIIKHTARIEKIIVADRITFSFLKIKIQILDFLFNVIQFFSIPIKFQPWISFLKIG